MSDFFYQLQDDLISSRNRRVFDFKMNITVCPIVFTLIIFGRSIKIRKCDLIDRLYGLVVKVP
jgi:hypothetical protein